MVYVAYGALLASLPLLLYAYRYHGWRSKSQSPPLAEASGPVKISTERSEKNRDEEVFNESHDDVKPSNPTFAVEDCDSKDAKKGGLKGGKPEESNAPPGSAADTFASSNEGKRSDADHAKPENTAKDEESTKTKMQPPARPGTRLRPKANDKMRPPAPLQQSNNSLRTPPTLSSTLRPPPSAASTLRTPPTRSLVPSSLSAAPTASTLPSSKRPSKKVLLEPGHSPLDWANLINNPPSSSYLRGDDVPSSLIRVTPSQLRYHNGRKGRNAWGVWQGKVYNLTPYMKFHPGGVDELMKGAGREKDGERLFMEIHPWVNWEGLLGECLVGILVSEEQVGSGLEDMD
ncbi:MAG: hypothetical protein Q9219_004023 [cf. Caloplaca sp. 3 TL-2023]